MKKRILAWVLLMAILAVVLCLPMQALQPDQNTDLYFALQLSDNARLIYDALSGEEARELLMRGMPVTVGEEFSIVIPQSPTQTEYNSLTSSFQAEAQRLGGLLQELSNAAAALDRDLPALFWTGGIYGYTEILENGIPMEGAVSMRLGNTYTVALRVGLYVTSDWNVEDGGARDLDADIATLSAAIEALAKGAEQASDNFYGRLKYVNDQLCKFNAYNSAAASANGSAGYGHSYPWTPLAALDQLETEEDGNGSLKPVCEGYARAFKLVCDRLSIPCLLISGTGNGEDHMWNYVRMEDGLWYGVDVTWNDSAETDTYFLTSKAIMNEDHTPNTRFMGDGQTIDFVYPELADHLYDPNKLTLQVSAISFVGGGELVLTAGGALEGSLQLTSDSDLILTKEGERSWKTVLPNANKTYTFTLTYTGDGVYNGITATCTVTVVAHTHAFGAWGTHDQNQHKAACSCGEETYAAHAWGEKVVTPPTESLDGSWKQTCVCGAELRGSIPMTEPDETTDSAESDTQTDETKKPDTSGNHSVSSNNNQSDVSLLGCSVSVTGVPIVLLVSFGALVLSKRKRF